MAASGLRRADDLLRVGQAAGPVPGLHFRPAPHAAFPDRVRLGQDRHFFRDAFLQPGRVGPGSVRPGVYLQADSGVTQPRRRRALAHEPENGRPPAPAGGGRNHPRLHRRRGGRFRRVQRRHEGQGQGGGRSELHPAEMEGQRGVHRQPGLLLRMRPGGKGVDHHALVGVRRDAGPRPCQSPEGHAPLGGQGAGHPGHEPHQRPVPDQGHRRESLPELREPHQHHHREERGNHRRTSVPELREPGEGVHSADDALHPQARVRPGPAPGRPFHLDRPRE